MSGPECTCELETHFSAGQDDDEKKWVVIDAECVIVATCPERRFAELIAEALNRSADPVMCRFCLVHQGADDYGEENET